MGPTCCSSVAIIVGILSPAHVQPASKQGSPQGQSDHLSRAPPHALIKSRTCTSHSTHARTDCRRVKINTPAAGLIPPCKPSQHPHNTNIYVKQHATHTYNANRGKYYKIKRVSFVLAAVSGTYQRFLWCSDRLFCADTCHTCGQEHGQTFAREKSERSGAEGMGSRNREERTKYQGRGDFLLRTIFLIAQIQGEYRRNCALHQKKR